VATAHIPAGTIHSGQAGISAAQRRRAARQPAGWLLVEAESLDGAQRLSGRLLDTSDGGLGLVLRERPAIGCVLRITPAGSVSEDDSAPAWHGREARVVHTAPLSGGSWRVGLSFTCAAPSSLQMLGTRLVLLAAVILAVASYTATQGASLAASAIVGAIAVALGIGAEWQYRSELRTFHRSQSSPQVQS
jgi:hypothetical protein